MKCRKFCRIARGWVTNRNLQNSYSFSEVYFVVTVREWIMLTSDELEFQICTNCINIQYKMYKPFEKNVNVYYQRLLTFVIFS